MAGIPVVIKASGGLPVTVVSNGFGTPMEVAANGYGLAVTQVANGLPVVGIAAGGTSVPVSQFLSRTSGLDAPHTVAYTALIDGLVADGVWPLIDALYIQATQNAATALQNIKSSSYTATIVGAPVFTVDRGYVGVLDGYFRTGLNASTAGGQYQQNSAHMAVWVEADAGGTDQGGMVGTEPGGGTRMYILPRLGGNAYFRINTGGGPSVAIATASGLILANRSSATNVQGYRNGGAPIVTTTSDASAALNNVVFTSPDMSTSADWIYRCCATCFGGSLTQAQVTALYARLRTYMTAVGVP